MRESKFDEGDKILYWVPDSSIPLRGTVEGVNYRENIDMFVYTIRDVDIGPNEIVIRIEPGIVLLEIDFTELLLM